MDQGTLVDIEIADGQRLIERLITEGIAVTAAGWIRESDSGLWFLYIATPLVGEDGATRPAYRRLLAVIRQMEKEGFSVDPFEVKLIGSDDPVAKDILAIHARAPGRRGSPIRWGGTTLGNVSIEGAYLYPLPAVTPE